MSIAYVICSRYSKACADFMATVNDNGIKDIVPVYIDNAASREAIVRSPLDIKTVPCVVGTVNGFFATYEGRDAFAWLEDIVTKSQPAPSPDSEIQRPDESPGIINGNKGKKLENSKAIAEQMQRDREIDDMKLHGANRMRM